MATYREHISEIITDARKLYIDAYLPNGYIYHKLIEKGLSLVKRDSDNRRIFSQSHTFITINNFRLVNSDKDFYGIGNFTHAIGFMQTEKILPDVFTTYTGLAISVNTVEPSDKHFTEIRYSQYPNIMKREYRDTTEVYFWFQNKRLVFPEVSYKAVRIDGPFINPLEVKNLNGENTSCEKLLDQPFLCPDYLQDDIKNAIVADILKEYGSQHPDEAPDMNENNLASKQMS